MPTRMSGLGAWAAPNRHAASVMIPSLTLRACIRACIRACAGLSVIHEGLPGPREPALLTSGGRMPKRSQHRVSAGRMPERTSGDGAWAAPNCRAASMMIPSLTPRAFIGIGVIHDRLPMSPNRRGFQEDSKTAQTSQPRRYSRRSNPLTSSRLLFMAAASQSNSPCTR